MTQEPEGHFERVRERLAELDEEGIALIESTMLCLAMKNREAACNLNYDKGIRRKCQEQGINQYMFLEEVFGHPNMNRLQLEAVRI